MKGYFSFKGKEQKLIYLEQLMKDVFSEESCVIDEQKRKEVIFEFQREKKNGEYFEKYLKQLKQSQSDNYPHKLINLAEVISVFLEVNQQNPSRVLQILQGARQIYQIQAMDTVFSQKILQRAPQNDIKYWINYYVQIQNNSKSGLDKLDNLIITLTLDQNLYETQLRKYHQEMLLAGLDLQFCG